MSPLYSSFETKTNSLEATMSPGPPPAVTLNNFLFEKKNNPSFKALKLWDVSENLSYEGDLILIENLICDSMFVGDSSKAFENE